MELLMTTILCKHMIKLKESPNSYISSDKLQNTLPLNFQPSYA